MPARPTPLLLLLAACTAELPDRRDADATALPGVDATVGTDGLWLDAGSFGLVTERWGREGSAALQPAAAPRDGECWALPASRLVDCATSLERPLVGAVERWRAAGEGVQQAWTLAEAPAGSGPVEIDVRVRGADPTLDGEQVVLETESGATWTYAGLQAWDARGRALPAWMTVDGDLIEIHVDDEGATWPLTVDPVVSSASTTLTQSSTDFGIGVTMGNFNGDTYGDVGVGARFGTSLYGEAFTYHGSSSGVSTTYARKLTSTGYYGKFGEYVDGHGDVNGDGYDDLVVCEFYDETFFVYKGSSTGIPSTATTTVTGVYGLGRGLATADWNHDGYDDVMAGAQEPTAEVYRGSSSGLNTTRYYTTSTLTEAPSVATAGDVNGDGYEEFIYGLGGSNAAYVLMGGSSPPSSTKTLSRSGSSEFGFSVAGGGDIDGDGYDDVVVGDPTYSSGTGRVTVFYGSSAGLSTSDYTVVSSPTSGIGFGYTIELVGDVNGDGYDDIAVADDYDSSNAYVFQGSAAGIAATPSRSLNIGDANFGYDIDGREDVNGDGYDDVVFGSIGSTAYVYHGCADADGDGECTDLDCDDGNAAINTSATEVCDDVDNDCDGDIDDADSSVSGGSTWYRDADGDNYGVAPTTTTACDRPSGYAAVTSDCNDGSASINPGATEIAGDNVDSNCDARETCYVDADDDGYRTSSTLSSTDGDCNDIGEALATDPTGDCDDTSASISPAMAETAGDGVDSNCDGAETCYADGDDDGYRTSSTISSSDADCSDVGEALASDSGGDCDDAASAINPAASEVCDGVDNDCDGLSDGADPSVDSSSQTRYYADADGDGYGNAGVSALSCSIPGGYVVDATDCDDGSAAINPGASEGVGDGVDSNCDGAEVCYVDSDDDGSRTDATAVSGDGDCADAGEALASDMSGDCDDTSVAIHPGATEDVGDEIDSDCDGAEVCYIDSDDDGYRSSSTAASSDVDCQDAGEALASDTSGDCDDANRAINPAASEVCDGADNDCDGRIDLDDPSNDPTTTLTSYADADGDGYGNSGAGAVSCTTPVGYVLDSSDCDDTSATTYPGATEIVADGIDSDCDGQETCYEDLDGDSYRTSTTTTSADGDCADSGEALASDAADDCDDTDADVYPGAPDPTYDGIDQACDGESNDLDGDGHDATEAGGDDCDDTDADVFPGAPDPSYDGIDQGCDGESNDLDGDGHDAEEAGGDDCDDGDATVYPGAAELDDGLDNDCDGHDELYDGDGDGLSDLDEAELGTDPTNPDTDGGSVNDGDEVARGTDPLDASDDVEEPDDTGVVDDTGSKTYEGGCDCSSAPDAPVSGARWLFAMAPLLLLRRRR